MTSEPFADALDEARLFPPPAPSAPASERVPLSVRVDPALRARIIASTERAGADDLSAGVRRLLELGLAAEDAGARAMRPSAGASRRRGGPAQREAAKIAAPRTGTARHDALLAIVRAGARGRTPDEVAVALEPRPLQCTVRRVTDLLQAGLIEPARRARGVDPQLVYVRVGVYGARPFAPDESTFDDETVSRRTRTGARATVYVPTDAGLAALAAAGRDHEERQR